MTTANLAQYKAFWRKLAEAEPTPEMWLAIENARTEARRLAQVLADEFGAEKVYLFGSFAWGNQVRPESDIDLAVVGLLPGRLIPADVRLSALSKYKVDLVPLTQVGAHLSSRILKSGLLVYEREPTPTLS